MRRVALSDSLIFGKLENDLISLEGKQDDLCSALSSQRKLPGQGAGCRVWGRADPSPPWVSTGFGFGARRCCAFDPSPVKQDESLYFMVVENRMSYTLCQTSVSIICY